MPRRLKRLGPGNPHLIPLIFKDLCLVWWGTLLEQRWPKRRRLPRVSKPGDRSTAYSVQCYACAGWRHIACNCPDVVAILHMDVGANNCIWIFVTRGIVRSVSNTFALSVKTCLFYFVVGWDLYPCPVDLGGTFSVSQFRTVPFHSVLGILSLIGRETQYSPAVYLCRRRSSPLYFTGNQSLCWPLASSGASSVSSRIG